MAYLRSSTLGIFAYLTTVMAIGFSWPAAANIVTFDLVCNYCTRTGTIQFDTIGNGVVSASIETGASEGFAAPPEYTTGTYFDTGGGVHAFLFSNGGFNLLLLGIIDPLSFISANGLTQGSQELGFFDEVGVRSITGYIAPTAVPLPAALPLFAGGLGLLGWMAKRRRKARQLEPLISLTLSGSTLS